MMKKMDGGVLRISMGVSKEMNCTARLLVALRRERVRFFCLLFCLGRWPTRLWAGRDILQFGVTDTNRLISWHSRH